MNKTNHRAATCIVLIILALAAVPALAGGDLTLISPNNGANLTAGQKIHIHWSYSDYPDSAKVRIVLQQSGAEKGVIAAGAPIHTGDYSSGNGGFWWTVGQTTGGAVAAGCAYSVVISVKDHPEAGAQGSKDFCVMGKNQEVSLKVLSPNGGEKLLPGNTHLISWSSTGLTGKVKIQLRKQGWATDRAIANDVPIESGGYSWKVGDLLPPAADLTDPGSGFKVYIQTLDGKAADESDGAFSLAQKIIPNLGSGNTGRPSIDVTSPKAGDVAPRFSPVFVKWTHSAQLDGKYGKMVLRSVADDSEYVIDKKVPFKIGEYRWNVPGIDFVKTGSHKIRLESLDTPGVFDYSGAFTVGADDGEIVYAPYRGFGVKPGDSFTIAWRKDYFPTATVRLELYKEDKKTRLGDIAPYYAEKKIANDGECETWVYFRAGYEEGKQFRIKVSDANGKLAAWSAPFIVTPLQSVPTVKTFDSANLMWWEKRAKEDEGAWKYLEQKFEGFRAGVWSRFEDLKRGGFLYQGFAFRTYLSPGQSFRGWEISKAEVKLRVSAQNFIDAGMKAIYLYTRDDSTMALNSPITLVQRIDDPGNRQKVIAIDVTKIMQDVAADKRGFYGFVFRGWNEDIEEPRALSAFFYIYEPRLEVTKIEKK